MQKELFAMLNNALGHTPLANLGFAVLHTGGSQFKKYHLKEVSVCRRS